MLNKKMVEVLNEQINEELYSAYLYLAMSNYFESIGLKGFANWMMVQYKEETDHAMKIYNYLHSHGEKAKLLAIKQPPTEWSSPLHAFDETLKHEQHITKCINDLLDLAEELRDRATYSFLQWYIDEQVEEESNDREIIDKLRLVEDSRNGLFMLDKELSQRVYTPLEEVK
ncbi:MAG TPA: ferritin [Thermoplasmatales archaeon]|nr:ferritin [Thermoplasmatales archaeon]